MALRGLRSAFNRGDTKGTAGEGSADGGSGVQWGPPAGTLDTLAAKSGTTHAPANELPAWLPQPAGQPAAGRWARGATRAPAPELDPPTDEDRRPLAAARGFGPQPNELEPREVAAAPGANSRFGFRSDSLSGAPAGTGARAAGLAAHCPGCGEPIAKGARRCASCGRRFMLGVPAGRASLLVGAGMLAGLVVGGLVVGIALPRDAATAGVGPAASNAAPSFVPVSANAAAALRGTTALNGRLASEAEPLSAALAETSFPVQDVVKVLRRMSSDARAATAMVGSLADWPQATSHQTQLQAFYDQLTGEINTGLGASVTSADAYKGSARAILATLRSIVGLDATARELAAQSGITLPEVAIPAALR